MTVLGDGVMGQLEFPCPGDQWARNPSQPQACPDVSPGIAEGFFLEGSRSPAFLSLLCCQWLLMEGRIPNFVIPGLPPARIAAVGSFLTPFVEMLWQNLIFTLWYMYFPPHKWKGYELDFQNKQDLPFSFLFILLSVPWPLAARQPLCLCVSMTCI